MPIARDRKGVLVLVASMGAVMATGAMAGAVAALSPGGVSDGGTRPYRLIVPATAAGLPLDRSQTEAYGTVDMSSPPGQGSLPLGDQSHGHSEHAISHARSFVTASHSWGTPPCGL
ncbi:hypothetical protein ACQPZ8_20450 [Actinomadura nitritigenes]|uniref:hypothetical protein n=1 Tax=Actinomadura nitritigenes TaxID=134602 RepID=UPI003D8BCC0B